MIHLRLKDFMKSQERYLLQYFTTFRKYACQRQHQLIVKGVEKCFFRARKIHEARDFHKGKENHDALSAVYSMSQRENILKCSFFYVIA